MNNENSGAPALGACFVFVSWLLSLLLFSVLSLEWHAAFREQLSQSALGSPSNLQSATQTKRRRRLHKLAKVKLGM
jgi:hypothetical protein